MKSAIDESGLFFRLVLSLHVTFAILCWPKKVAVKKTDSQHLKDYIVFLFFRVHLLILAIIFLCAVASVKKPARFLPM